MDCDDELDFEYLRVVFCSQVTTHLTEDFLLNAAISRLMGLTNTLAVSPPRVLHTKLIKLKHLIIPLLSRHHFG